MVGTIQATGQLCAWTKAQGLLAQTLPLGSAAHKFQPGNRVLVKSWKETKLQPDWKGAFQVLLITETVVQPAEKGWTHYTGIKGPIEPPKDEWNGIERLRAGLGILRNTDGVRYEPKAPLGIDISKRVEEDSIKVPKLKKKIRWLAS